MENHSSSRWSKLSTFNTCLSQHCFQVLGVSSQWPTIKNSFLSQIAISLPLNPSSNTVQSLPLEMVNRPEPMPTYNSISLWYWNIRVVAGRKWLPSAFHSAISYMAATSGLIYEPEISGNIQLSCPIPLGKAHDNIDRVTPCKLISKGWHNDKDGFIVRVRSVGPKFGYSCDLAVVWFLAKCRLSPWEYGHNVFLRQIQIPPGVQLQPVSILKWPFIFFVERASIWWNRAERLGYGVVYDCSDRCALYRGSKWDPIERKREEKKRNQRLGPHSRLSNYFRVANSIRMAVHRNGGFIYERVAWLYSRPKRSRAASSAQAHQQSWEALETPGYACTKDKPNISSAARQTHNMNMLHLWYKTGAELCRQTFALQRHQIVSYGLSEKYPTCLMAQKTTAEYR